MELKVNEEATRFLRGLKRIKTVEEGAHYSEDVLFLPEQVDICAFEDSNVKTIGLGEKLDGKTKDLLRIIVVEDANNMKYRETNILSPSVFVHSLSNIPWHITTQGFLVTTLSEETKKYIETEEINLRAYYGKHTLDRFWLPCSKRISKTSSEELVCIFNRRVGGWDGTIERPVIELLGAGGHLQAIWDDEQKRFRNRTLFDNLKKEFSEEIGLSISEEDMKCIGGFINEETNELVSFFCILVDDQSIKRIQEYSLGNISENIDGIYLGTFKETMKQYLKDPSLFAGGVRAAKTNFPNNRFIMERIKETFLNKKM